MTDQSFEDVVKLQIANAADLYTVKFQKADGTMRAMEVSKMDQAKDVERLAVEREEKLKAGGVVKEHSAKAPDPFLMKVFEKTDAEGQWRSFDLRKVESLRIGSALIIRVND